MKKLEDLSAIKQLLSYVTNSFDPHSCLMTKGFLRMEVRFFPCGNEYYVDNWPRPKLIAIYLRPAHSQFIQNAVHIHAAAADPCDVTNCLRSLRHLLFNPEAPCQFIGLSSDLLATVKEMLLEAEVDMKLYSPVTLVPYVLPDTSDVARGMPSLPEGYRCCTLSLEHAEQVLSQWDYVNSTTEKMVRVMIDKFPNVAIADKNGELIGHELCYPYQALGVLHVNADHRRRGLAQYLTLQLVERMRSNGDDVYVVITPDNIASVQFHEKLGFQVVKDHSVHILSLF